MFKKALGMTLGDAAQAFMDNNSKKHENQNYYLLVFIFPKVIPWGIP